MSKKNTKKTNKKNRTKIVTLIISVTILILIVGCYFGYKIYLLNIYTLTKPDNVEEVIKGLKNKKEITVNKKSINEEYLNYQIEIRICRLLSFRFRQIPSASL